MDAEAAAPSKLPPPLALVDVLGYIGDGLPGSENGIIGVQGAALQIVVGGLVILAAALR